MGDRANIYFKDQENAGVFLYTHWGGTELPATLQTALAKRWRWNDPQYLVRIIFCEMVKDYIEEESGFGISTQIGDGDDRVLIVDPYKQTVTTANMEEQPFVKIVEKTWTFEEYLKVDPEEVWQYEN